MTPAVKAYLLVYNLAAMAGWAYVLLRALQSPHDPYGAIQLPLCIVQTAALLEIGHSMAGLVRAAPATTAMQVLSRVWVLWGICVPVAAAQQSTAFLLMSISWALVEVPRYAFYAMVLFTTPPYALTWIRYSMFFVLYITGISGELLCVYAALPTIRDSDMWTLTMPNALNVAFSYYYAVVLLCVLYVPGAPVLYSHMMKLRYKKLRKTKTQ